jgi:ABC-2 type transport system permease protein
MMDDIRTVLWKEWKELLLQRNLTRNEKFARVLAVIVIFGVLLWRTGPMMMTTPAAFLMPSLLPLFFLSAIVADSFAGERERHTLETLLTTRLSDDSILIGKLLASVLLIWAVLLFALGTGIVSANIRNHGGGWVLPPADRFIPLLMFYFLLSLALGSAGVLVSLRASTVRQAMQILNIGLMVLIFSLLYAFQMLPTEWRIRLAQALTTENLKNTEMVIALILIACDLALFAAARLRFKRARLILE